MHALTDDASGDISLIIESAVIMQFKKNIQILHKKSAKKAKAWC